MRLKKQLVGASLVATAALLLASSAFAQKTKAVIFGTTSVQLSSEFTGGLKSLGLEANTVSPSMLAGGTVTFPIVAGAIDLDTAAGEIIHSGGLVLENEEKNESDETAVRLQSFTIDTTNPQKPILTGLVILNNQLLGRFPLFNLALPSGITLPLKAEGGFVLQLNGVGVTLTQTAATTLNSVYKTKALTAGFPVGTASVFAIVQSYREK